MAAFTRPNWTEAVEQTLLEAYQVRREGGREEGKGREGGCE